MEELIPFISHNNLIDIPKTYGILFTPYKFTPFYRLLCCCVLLWTLVMTYNDLYTLLQLSYWTMIASSIYFIYISFAQFISQPNLVYHFPDKNVVKVITILYQFSFSAGLVVSIVFWSTEYQHMSEIMNSEGVLKIIAHFGVFVMTAIDVLLCNASFPLKEYHNMTLIMLLYGIADGVYLILYRYPVDNSALLVFIGVVFGTVASYGLGNAITKLKPDKPTKADLHA